MQPWQRTPFWAGWQLQLAQPSQHFGYWSQLWSVSKFGQCIELQSFSRSNVVDNINADTFGVSLKCYAYCPKSTFVSIALFVALFAVRIVRAIWMWTRTWLGGLSYGKSNRAFIVYVVFTNSNYAYLHLLNQCRIVTRTIPPLRMAMEMWALFSLSTRHRMWLCAILAPIRSVFPCFIFW